MNSSQNRQKRDGREISDAFRKCSHVPDCLGAIVGKHIRFTKFPRGGSTNLNYKCYFSIFLMEIAIQITNLHMLTLGLTETTDIRLFFKKPPF